jgi:DNA helicase-2/ATP-dependent DNA helicase PcrA
VTQSGVPELNPPQAEAAAHVRGPLLIFAGAGSGKTRTLTMRIANIVANHRVPPYRVLAVTFTNKAAREMQERLVKLLGEEVARDLWVGTFHATCARLLRRYGEAVGLSKSFTIYDTADQKQIVSRVLDELRLDDRRYKPMQVLHQILAQKQEGRGPGDMRTKGYFDDAVANVYAKYNQYLRAANAVDFEDLLSLVVEILENTELPASREIERRFDFVLVDEFQDTNQMQYRFLKALAREHKNLCVVGDDDQSIYRWRGADVRNIRGFLNDFADARMIKLEQNYRSTKNIVAAALGVIEPSRDRVPKDLWTDNPPGELVHVVEAANERDEAALVAKTIEEARRSGITPGEIAVFYRIHAQSRVLEEALRSMNVEYQIIGGTKFYERAEVKDALSYLRVLANPKSDVDLMRIVNVPARGIGKTTVERLARFASREKISVYDALLRVDEVEDLGPAPRKKLASVRELLDRLMKGAESAEPRHVLEEVLDATGYLQGLREQNTAEADARIENLEELSTSLDEYAIEAAAAGDEPTLAGFLERVSLVADADSPHGGGRVTLMTIHAAKGLEFELVLLTGMEDDMFPYRSAESRQRGTDEEDLEEERRLAYVAITRARTRLLCSFARTRHIFGGVRGVGPSRFLRNLPKDVIRESRTPAAAAAPGRFIDRVAERVEVPSFRHPIPRRPQTDRAPSSAPPGETWVDRDYFADEIPGFEALDVRKGAEVWHERFGEGKIVGKTRSAMGEQAAIVFFPGWGQRTILVRFLRFG